jgi:two-component system chemotaxis response regulator CheB
MAEIAPLRVLVVDDSAYMRHVLTKGLSAAPGLTVVGTARDGLEALGLLDTLHPDVVTLDIEMPQLDGLSTLRQIMATRPLPVIMVSSLTRQGASETIQALTAGAVDFVTKPDNRANIGAVLDELAIKVRGAAQARVVRPTARAIPVAVESAAGAGSAKPTRRWRAAARDRLVVIGASTGGPRALGKVLGDLPGDLPAAVLVIQHMPVGFTRSLAERLNSLSPLAVKEAEAGDCLEIGKALVAPGGYHMTIDAQGQIGLNQGPTVQGVRPAIDVTMASVARHCGPAALGVVLTGMGHDGTNGAALMRASGSQIIAEAASTCVVWGMPRSVTEAGLADQVAPLEEVAAAITHWATTR